MKFRVMSDIHLEFGTFIPSYEKDEENTTLLLAGDIGTWGKKGRVLTKFLEQLCKRFEYVFMIPGNHEYYGTSIERIHRKLAELQEMEEFDNFYFLQNTYNIIDNKYLVYGATMWTDFDKGSPFTMSQAQERMNDFRYIRFGENYRKFYPNDALSLHLTYVRRLKEILEAEEFEDLTKVVMTHHAPCHLSIAQKFMGDELNGAYYTDLSELILDTKPALWVHGHVHNSSDYELGETRVVCNPRGYAPLI